MSNKGSSESLDRLSESLGRVEMEADAPKNEVQKQVIEGRQMMRMHQLQDDD